MTFVLDLQLHLEESFFHNHPASMKRTVEFVADRVSSNYIKKFRAGHLPKLVQEGSAKVKDVIQMLAGGFDTRSKVGYLFKHFFKLLNGTTNFYSFQLKIILFLMSLTNSHIRAILYKVTCNLVAS